MDFSMKRNDTIQLSTGVQDLLELLNEAQKEILDERIGFKNFEISGSIFLISGGYVRDKVSTPTQN